MPGGTVAGMPIDILNAAFELPFKLEAEGGCPAIPPPPMPQSASEAQRLGGAGANRGRGHRAFGVTEALGPKVQAAFREAAKMALDAGDPRLA